MAEAGFPGEDGSPQLDAAQVAEQLAADLDREGCEYAVDGALALGCMVCSGKVMTKTSGMTTNRNAVTSVGMETHRTGGNVEIVRLAEVFLLE